MNRILNPETLCSGGSEKAKALLLDIMDCGLTAADPYYSTKQLMHLEDDTLVFSGSDFEASGDPFAGPARYVLTADTRIYLFAIGKGIQRIAKAVEETLGERLTGGYVIAKTGDPVIMERLEVTLGGHPTPDEHCVEGCARMLRIIESAHFTRNDLVITAIGNGVSSLMTLPSAGVALQDVVRCVELLQIENGLPTSELNHVRNNIDRLKGGRFTKLLQPARTVHLIAASPAVNDTAAHKGYDALIHCNYWLHTLPDQTSPSHALQYLDARELTGKLPSSIRRLLASGGEPAGITPEAFIAASPRVFALMPACRGAVAMAMARAQECGLTPYLLTEKTQCEASAIGKFIALMACHCAGGASPFSRPCALFTAGEMLVTCGSGSGVGGRNQEFIVAAALALRGYPQIAVASVDTDGTDGPGGFICDEAAAAGIRELAGGVADGFTAGIAAEAGIDLGAALARHDVSAALWRLGGGIIATHNVSVGDLSCCIIL